MAYRDAERASQARISALEAEVAELREARRRAVAEQSETVQRAMDQEAALAAMKGELAVARLRAQQEASILIAEREQMRLSLEQSLQVERDVLRLRGEAEARRAQAECAVARTESARGQRDAARLRERVARLEAEIEALLCGVEVADRFYAARLAELSATAHAEASRRDALGSTDGRDDAVDDGGALADARRELARVTACRAGLRGRDAGIFESGQDPKKTP